MVAGIPERSHFQAFPLLLKDSFFTLLTASPDTSQPPDPGISALLKALNNYLGDHDVTPLVAPAVASIDISYQLRDFFDRLNSYENVFNTGEEAEARAESVEENQQLGTFLEAVTTYLQAKRTPIISYGETFPPATVSPEENQRPRLWKRIISPEGNSKLQAVDGIDFSKKAVICIGGLSCFHDNPKALNGFAKVAETTLGGPQIYKEGIEVYCLSHPTAHRALCESRTCFYNSDAEHYASASAQDFVALYMLPAPGVETGDKIPIVQLKDKLRHFNFFAFSYGTVFVKEVRNALCQQLQQRGYNDAEISEVLMEVYSLNLGVTCRLDAPKTCGNFSSVYVVSSNDIISRSRTNIKKWLQGKVTDEPALIRISDNELLAWTNSPKTTGLIEQLHGKIVSPGSGKPYAATLPTGHFPTLYASRTPKNDPVIVERSLRHAVQGERFKSPLQALSPISLTPPPSYSAVSPTPNAFLMRAFANLIGIGPEESFSHII